MKTINDITSKEAAQALLLNTGKGFCWIGRWGKSVGKAIISSPDTPKKETVSFTPVNVEKEEVVTIISDLKKALRDQEDRILKFKTKATSQDN